MGVGAEPRQLGHAVDQPGDLAAKALLDVRQVVFGVLGDVVQQRGFDRHRVDAQVGQDLGRGDRVGDVRFARRPPLTLVGLGRQVEGQVHRRQVGLRVVAADGGDEVGPKPIEIRLEPYRGPDRGQRPTRSPAGGLFFGFRARRGHEPRISAPEGRSDQRTASRKRRVRSWRG